MSLFPLKSGVPHQQTANQHWAQLCINWPNKGPIEPRKGTAFGVSSGVLKKKNKYPLKKKKSFSLAAHEKAIYI